MDEAKFVKLPRPPNCKKLWRGKKGGGRAFRKKFMWALQKRLAKKHPGLLRLNSRDFRWWFRWQRHLRLTEKGQAASELRTTLMDLMLDQSRDDLMRAEDERVLGQVG